MSGDTLFEERQRMTQWWVVLPLLLVNGMIFVGIYIQLIQDTPFGDNPMSDMGLIITAFFTVGITAFLLSLRLDTRVRHDGIEVRFFPFAHKKYFWGTVAKAYIRQYRPIREYGGWGYRGLNKNRAFSMSGDMGLQLEFNDKTKLLIGTRRPAELEDALRKMGRLDD